MIQIKITVKDGDDAQAIVELLTTDGFLYTQLPLILEVVDLETIAARSELSLSTVAESLDSLSGRSMLELAPFFDVGMSWNHNREPPRRTLASAGVGLRYAWAHYLRAEVYWGGKLISTEQSAPGLQGHGLHVQITGSLP